MRTGLTREILARPAALDARQHTKRRSCALGPEQRNEVLAPVARRRPDRRSTRRARSHSPMPPNIRPSGGRPPARQDGSDRAQRLSGVDPANRLNQARDAALQAVQRCRRGVLARVSSGLGEPHDTKPVGPAPFRARATLVRSSASPKRRLRTAQRRPNPVRRQPGTSTTHVPDTSNNSSGLRDAWIC
jgi:hypothetical protein